MPHSAPLWPTGINLILIDIPHNITSATNNDMIHVLCPSNHYSSQPFDPRKPSLLLLHQDGFFNPIYLVELSSGFATRRVQSVVHRVIPFQHSFFRSFLTKIQHLYSHECLPQRDALTLHRLMQQFNNNRYSISSQVVNFQAKVIGVWVVNVDDDSSRSFYVPCVPSAINSTIRDWIYITDIAPSDFSDYATTFAFLVDFFQLEESSSAHNQWVEIRQQDLVIGFMKQPGGDLFIPIYPHALASSVEQQQSVPLPQKQYGDVWLAESMQSFDQSDQDKSRIGYMRKVEQETHYFKLFRTTLRLLLRTDSQKFDQLQKRCEKTDHTTYTRQLNDIVTLLKEWLHSKVQFVSDPHQLLSSSVPTSASASNLFLSPVSPITSSHSIGISSGSSSGNDALLFPKHNLQNPTIDNGQYYYRRLADELMRNHRIRSFLFEPYVFSMLDQVPFSLGKDELLLTESALQAIHSNPLVPDSRLNSFVRQLTWSTAQPILPKGNRNPKRTPWGKTV